MEVVMSQWKLIDFIRKHYRIEQGPDKELDKARSIEAQILINGKLFARLQLREPGILALVSRPEDEGIDIEVVEARNYQFQDQRLPNKMVEHEVQPWQAQALGVK